MAVVLGVGVGHLKLRLSSRACLLSDVPLSQSAERQARGKRSRGQLRAMPVACKLKIVTATSRDQPLRDSCFTKLNSQRLSEQLATISYCTD